MANPNDFKIQEGATTSWPIKYQEFVNFTVNGINALEAYKASAEAQIQSAIDQVNAANTQLTAAVAEQTVQYNAGVSTGHDDVHRLKLGMTAAEHPVSVGVWTKVPLDLNIYQRSMSHDATNKRAVSTIASNYDAVATVEVRLTDDGTNPYAQIDLQIRKNGSVVASDRCDAEALSDDYSTVAADVSNLSLSVNDYLEAWVLVTSPKNPGVKIHQSGTIMQIHRRV